MLKMLIVILFTAIMFNLAYSAALNTKLDYIDKLVRRGADINNLTGGK